MVSTWISFTSLYTAVLLLLMGMGLLGTLLSLKMTLEGFPAQVTGLIMAAYYAGLTVGSLNCHRLIERVGHIRSFAAFAAVTTATVMLHGLYISPVSWGILRFVTGVANIGLYMVIESWLNECTAPQARGRVFSVYMVLTYLGIGVGQLLLNLGDTRGLEHFFIVGILLALCLVPVVATHTVHPELPQTVRFSFVDLFRRAPLGMLGCVAAGMMNSGFYAMGPVFSSRIGLTVSQVGWFMAVTIFGGLLMQWPVGTVSDRFDRTRVLGVMAASVAVISLLVMTIATGTFIGLLTAMVLLGGLLFTIYPVAVARTHDLFEPRDVVPVSAALLMSYSLGATIGPIGASSVMAAVADPRGIFIYFAIVGGTYAFIVFYCRKKDIVRIVPAEEHVDFIPMRSTSPVATAIDPRAEPESDDAGAAEKASVEPPLSN